MGKTTKKKAVLDKIVDLPSEPKTETVLVKASIQDTEEVTKLDADGSPAVDSKNNPVMIKQAKKDKNGKNIMIEGMCEVEIPTTLQGYLDLFGEDIIGVFKAAVIGKFQGAIRSALTAGRDPSEASKWKPGTRKKKSAEEKAEELFKKLSPEAQQAFLTRFGSAS